MDGSAITFIVNFWNNNPLVFIACAIMLIAGVIAIPAGIIGLTIAKNRRN